MPKVDFISGPGHIEGGDSRVARGLPPGGPKLVVTPLGVFDFEPVTKAMRVASLHDGVTLAQVQERTGFDLVCDAAPPVTPPPTAVELATLRERVDGTGVLRAKFPWQKRRA